MYAIFLAGLIFFEVLADIFTKEDSIRKNPWTFFLAITCYLLANISWLISMRYRSNLSVGANIFAVSTGIIATIIGCGFYNEILTIKQIAGIGLGCISLALIMG